MQRAKPYRNRPTPNFVRTLGMANTQRFYLVQERGPTKFVIQNSAGRKYQVEVGSELRCSCPEGRGEHCMHTIFVLLKVFKLELENPLIWQVSFTDQDVSQLIERRFSNRNNGDGMGQRVSGGGMNAVRIQNMTSALQHQSDLARFRPSQSLSIPERALKEESKSTKIVDRMKLEQDPMCCICHEDMSAQDKLTYCKTGCGHNLHLDCVLVWAKHKQEAKDAITCPLCRTEWGPATLRKLRQEAGIEEYHVEEEKKEEVKQRRPPTPSFDRSFKCSICNHRILSEPRFHCTICPRMQLCQECYSMETHNDHEFIVLIRPGDAQWLPAPPRGSYADEQAMQEQTAAMNEYHRILDLLTNRELTPQENAKLNHLERTIRNHNRRNPGDMSRQVPRVSLADYLANVYDLALQSREIQVQANRRNTGDQCVFCEIPAHGALDQQFKPIKLRCGHLIHKCCLSSLFERKVPHCPIDRRPILEGFAAVIKQRRAAPPPRPPQTQRRIPNSQSQNVHQAQLLQQSANRTTRGFTFSGQRRSSLGRTNSQEGPIGSGGGRLPQQRTSIRGVSHRPNQRRQNFTSMRSGSQERQYSENPVVDELVREVIAQQHFHEEMLNFSGLSQESSQEGLPLSNYVGNVLPDRPRGLDQSLWSDFYVHENTVVTSPNPVSNYTSQNSGRAAPRNQPRQQPLRQNGTQRAALVPRRQTSQNRNPPPRPPVQQQQITHSQQQQRGTQQVQQQPRREQVQNNSQRSGSGRDSGGQTRAAPNIPTTNAIIQASAAVSNAQDTLADAERRLRNAENLVSQNATRMRQLTQALRQSNNQYQQMIDHSRFQLRGPGAERRIISVGNFLERQS